MTQIVQNFITRGFNVHDVTILQERLTRKLQRKWYDCWCGVQVRSCSPRTWCPRHRRPWWRNSRRQSCPAPPAAALASTAPRPIPPWWCARSAHPWSLGVARYPNSRTWRSGWRWWRSRAAIPPASAAGPRGGRSRGGNARSGRSSLRRSVSSRAPAAEWLWDSAGPGTPHSHHIAPGALGRSLCPWGNACHRGTAARACGHSPTSLEMTQWLLSWRGGERRWGGGWQSWPFLTRRNSTQESCWISEDLTTNGVKVILNESLQCDKNSREGHTGAMAQVRSLVMPQFLPSARDKLRYLQLIRENSSCLCKIHCWYCDFTTWMFDLVKRMMEEDRFNYKVHMPHRRNPRDHTVTPQFLLSARTK